MVEKYVRYEFKQVAVWETNHNFDHGYTRGILVINRNGILTTFILYRLI